MLPRDIAFEPPPRLVLWWESPADARGLGQRRVGPSIDAGEPDWVAHRAARRERPRLSRRPQALAPARNQPARPAAHGRAVRNGTATA
jgi:hypothetical protein